MFLFCFVPAKVVNKSKVHRSGSRKLEPRRHGIPLPSLKVLFSSLYLAIAWHLQGHWRRIKSPKLPPSLPTLTDPRLTTGAQPSTLFGLSHRLSYFWTLMICTSTGNCHSIIKGSLNFGVFKIIYLYLETLFRIIVSTAWLSQWPCSRDGPHHIPRTRFWYRSVCCVITLPYGFWWVYDFISLPDHGGT